MRITKKVTSVVLAVLMVVSMMAVMAVSASAATAVDVDSETAFVNAVNDANANPINITGDFALNQVVTFNSNKTVNFNDKTVTVNVNRAIVVETGKTVSFMGTTGGLYTNGDVGFILNKGTLYVYGGVYNALNMTTGGLSVVKNEPNAWFNMQGGEINAKYYGIYTHGENSRVWIQNTAKVHSVDASAISGNGLAANKGYYIYIDGGTITSDNNSAIYHPNEGTLQISPDKSQITIQGATAIYTKAGTTKITANKVSPDLLQIIGTGAKADYKYNGDGTTPTGDAVVIDNCNYPSGGPVVDIKFGTFTSTNGNAIASYVGQDDPNYKGADQERVENFISIGYEGYEPVFSSEVPEEYCADGYIPKDNGNNTYGVKVGTYVAQVGSTKYENLQDALNVVPNGGTVTVLKDIATSGNIFADGYVSGGNRTYTVDLGGYTVSGGTFIVADGNDVTFKNGTIESASYAIQNTATATVDFTATVKSTATDASAVFGAEGSTTNINGTVEGNKYGVIARGGTLNVAGKVTATNDDGRAITLNKGGAADINDGADIDGAYGVVVHKDANLNVNGGDIAGVYHAVSGNGTAADGPYTINVTGGTLTATNGAGIYNPNAQGTLKISGGNITGSTTAVAAGTNSTNIISGGTFSSPVPEEYCSNGYAPKDNGNGTYGVGPDTSNPLNPFMVNAEDAKQQDGNLFGLDNSIDYLAGTLLGVQKKGKVAAITSESGQETGSDIRFVAVLKTSLVQDPGVTDYGFVLGKVGSNKNTTTTNFNNLKANWGNGEKTVSAKGTSNNVCGDSAYGDSAYGDPTDGNTPYKYVTCAVNGVDDSSKIAARFYVVKGGKTYYAKYAGHNYNFTGCTAGYADAED